MTDMIWQPIETAPKTDPNVIPAEVAKRVLLRFGSDGFSVGYWDWYYAEGGHGYEPGQDAWIEPCSGDRLSLHFLDPPTDWMDLDSLNTTQGGANP